MALDVEHVRLAHVPPPVLGSATCAPCATLAEDYTNWRPSRGRRMQLCFFNVVRKGIADSGPKLIQRAAGKVSEVRHKIADKTSNLIQKTSETASEVGQKIAEKSVELTRKAARPEEDLEPSTANNTGEFKKRAAANDVH